MRFGRATTALVVFGTSLVILSLTAWDRLKAPSPHFHFVDLAHSFWGGRLDTDTPRQRLEAVENDAEAPHGFAEAVRRQTRNADDSPRGWNDWASYRILTLKSGEVLEGVFPWRDQKDERKHEFHALDGTIYHIDCRKDVKRGCHGNQPDVITYHVSFPPFPAVVMMPLTKIWGYAVNDVWVTLLFAAANALILFMLLQWLVLHGHSKRSRTENLWLTAMFVFGTVHFFSAVRGEVWFTALIIGVTLNLLALWCAIDLRRPLLAGLFVGLGMATRTPLAFSAVFIAIIAAFPDGHFRREQWGRAVSRLAMFAVPVALSLAALMVYNEARFGNPLEFGHRYLQEGARDAIRRHGLFSGWFFGPNLSAALVNPPVITFEGGPWLRITRHGLGLMWTTPALFLLLVSPNRSGLFKALVVTALVVALPGLFYQNTGWEQFGYRFGLDWLPMLILAFAVGGYALNRPVKALILFGILVNAVGAATFGRYGAMYY
ncbi:MAG: hypothetical protein ACI9OJ_002918 [Myxococcota bacterium]|jgi:hypothetical protein